MRGLEKLRAISPKTTGLATRVIRAAIIGAIALAVFNLDPKETMADEGAPTSRYLAQNYYNTLAANQAQPFDPSRLGGMRWVQPMFGINTFRSRDAQWGQGGQTWPDDDPRWIILGKPEGNRLNRMENLVQNHIYRPLNNQMKAQRWGEALFTLAHEFGHNMVNPQYSSNEASADYYAKTNFRNYGRTMGLDRHQLNRMWRANDKFNYVKAAPQ